MFQNKVDHIKNWISNISHPKKELGGHSICPFAKSANYKIIECDIKNIEIHNSNYDVIIFIVEDFLSLSDIEQWILYYNEKYEDWDFFEDCKSYDTYINEIQTNNQKLNLVLSQPKEKLNHYRKLLSNTNYYNFWSENYLKEILGKDYRTIIGIGTP